MAQPIEACVAETPTPDTWFNPDLDAEAFRTLGRQVMDDIASYFAALNTRPVFPARTLADVAPLFDAPVPETGQDPAAIVADWREKIVPNSTHMTSPRYFGFVMGSGSMIGVLAEAMAAALNQNTGTWKAAPAAVEIERLTIRWLAELIGYPPACGGLFLTGGTAANTTALQAALRRAAGPEKIRAGLAAAGRRYLVYTADHEVHASFYRAMDMLGLGTDALRLVPSRADFTMDPDALARMIADDLAAGDTPLMVVAQAGSINVGAIDPLDRLADVAERFGLWYHVDGACGAVGAMLPELTPRYRGIERADSVSLDPHKWLYVPYECGAILVRDPETLRESFPMGAAYLRGSLPTEYTGTEYYASGPQMSRGFRALKVWMTLRHYGADGYRRLLRQNIACARHLDRLVRTSEDFEPIHEPSLFIYSFRFAPATLRGERADALLDRLNQQMNDRLQASGLAFVMTTRVRGRVVLRLSICSHRTTLADIERVFEGFRAIGAELLAEARAA